MIKYPTVPQ